MAVAQFCCKSCGWIPAVSPPPRFCKRCGKPLSAGAGAGADQGAAAPGSGGSAAAADPLIGRILDGRYRVRDLLGEGGMGKVYRVEHVVLKQMFALKLMHPEFSSCAESRARFRREAKLAALLFHPHSVVVHDYWEGDGNHAYLLMEFLKGVSLAEYVERHPERRLPVSQAIEFVIPIAQVLAHAHAQEIVHRDIKPSNVWLTHHMGRLDHVKVLDFGLARALGEGITRDALRPPGTLAYMAPELWRFDHESLLSTGVDVYALGVLLYEIIVGELPFPGSDEALRRGHMKEEPPALSRKRPEEGISRELDLVVALMLAKQPSDRPTAAQVVTVLELLRRKLPPPSIRGLLAQQTVLLTQALRAQDFHSAPTKVLAPRIGDPTSELPKLRELDLLDAEIDQASMHLGTLSSEILQRAWIKAQDRPSALAGMEAAVLKASLEAQREEQELSLGRASLTERMEQAYERCRGLQRRLFELREKWRHLSPGEEQRGLAQEIEQLEWQLSDATPVPQPDPDFRQRQQQYLRKREELLDLRRRFAVLVLRQHAGLQPAQSALTQELAEDLERALVKYDNMVSATSWVAAPDCAQPT